MKQATKKKNVHGQIIGNPKYNAGDKVQTTLTGNDVLTISPGSFHNGLSWMYYFDENEMGCGQDYILPYQPKDESKEVKEGGEGFEGGDLHGMDEVIEALGYLLSSYRADFKNITGAELNDTHAVKYAKYVLNKYPSPKRGRFSY